ncbi:hypothetical protein [Paenibacillus alvei]|uniref:hypothetical protein n=1 Tax=Paenibacillus alvei TaxID=44250 RepID=UPI00227E2D33|nr:hypothetical protein [Paenibacillus alvei]MCY7486718.1 hypothetical protein [Paenibacillus alvei]
MDIFNGIKIDWGFSAADIWSNSMFVVSSLAAFILLGIAVGFAPKIIGLVKGVVSSKGKKA